MTRNEISSNSWVCKLWRRASLDQLFIWPMVKTFLLCEEEVVFYLNPNWNKSEVLNPLCSFRLTHETVVQVVKGSHIIRTFYFAPSLESRIGDRLLSYCTQYPRLWNVSASEPRKQSNFSIKENPAWKPVHYLHLLDLEVRLNTKRFEELAFSEWHKKQADCEYFFNLSKAIPGLDLITNAVFEENVRMIDSWCKYHNYDDAHVPEKAEKLISQPDGFSHDFKLKQHQLEAVGWMKNIEQNKSVGFECTDLIEWRTSKSQLRFVSKGASSSEGVVFPSQFANHTKRVCAQGGVLADEMGLGKTIEIIALVLATQKKLTHEEVQHNETIIPLDNKKGERKKASGEKESDEERANRDALLFKTSATLVVCPNHLVQQWVEEIQNRTQLRVVQLTTKAELVSTSYEDVIASDIVLASYSLLKNKNYFNIGRVMEANIKKQEEELRHSWINEQLQKVRSKGTQSKQPVLEHFHWHRLVVDEGHEIVDESFYTNTFNKYKTDFVWYCSGTPFPNELVMEGATKLLRFPESHCYRSWNNVTTMLANIYWRNTKESVKSEYSLPGTKSEVVLLDFSQFEAQYYKDETDINAKRKLCNSFQLDSKASKTLSQMRAELIPSIKKEIERLKGNLQEDQETIKRIQVKLAQCPAASRRGFEEMLKNRELDIKETLADLDKQNQRLSAYENMEVYTGPDFAGLSPISVTNGNANGHLENQNSNNNSSETNSDEASKMTVKALKEELIRRGVDVNAHKDYKKADWVALFMSTNEKSNSTNGSNSKRKLNDDDVLPVVQKKAKTEPKNEKADTKQNLLYLVDRFGTKMGNLVFYLKNLWEKDDSARVIIFSQFNDFLEKIADKILRPSGIQSSFVQGNIMRKNKALNSFKATDSQVKVIMLSLENAASGTNLFEASHVLLMDPITGTKKEAQAVEAQAIARAHRQGQREEVTVVRFLIKDTIEHEMYLNNYK
eukprot:Phypoly_transcript_02157.p1 GENE.Phypoly_transcript_02157~~Phypoly_transcript_02157.p1  ORF type:complete len:976 (+),score=126.80 Phypoly_transcript_02157:57-2930(+)